MIAVLVDRHFGNVVPVHQKIQGIQVAGQDLSFHEYGRGFVEPCPRTVFYICGPGGIVERMGRLMNGGGGGPIEAALQDRLGVAARQRDRGHAVVAARSERAAVPAEAIVS